MSEQTRSLHKSLAQAATDPGGNIVVRLVVHGGAPSQLYSFSFLAHARGKASCQLKCQRTGRHGKQIGATLGGRRFVRLINKLIDGKVLDIEQERPRFVPDSIVGCLTISDLQTVHSIYFLADARQARAQGKVPDAGLRDVVDEIYAIASDLLGGQSVKPAS